MTIKMKKLTEYFKERIKDRERWIKGYQKEIEAYNKILGEITRTTEGKSNG